MRSAQLAVEKVIQCVQVYSHMKWVHHCSFGQSTEYPNFYKVQNQIYLLNLFIKVYVIVLLSVCLTDTNENQLLKSRISSKCLVYKKLSSSSLGVTSTIFCLISIISLIIFTLQMLSSLIQYILDCSKILPCQSVHIVQHLLQHVL